MRIAGKGEEVRSPAAFDDDESARLVVLVPFLRIMIKVEEARASDGGFGGVFLRFFEEDLPVAER